MEDLVFLFLLCGVFLPPNCPIPPAGVLNRLKHSILMTSLMNMLNARALLGARDTFVTPSKSKSLPAGTCIIVCDYVCVLGVGQ